MNNAKGAAQMQATTPADRKDVAVLGFSNTLLSSRAPTNPPHENHASWRTLGDQSMLAISPQLHPNSPYTQPQLQASVPVGNATEAANAYHMRRPTDKIHWFRTDSNLALSASFSFKDAATSGSCLVGGA